MGSRPKSLLRLDGVPLIERHLAALHAAGIDEIVIVTGYHYAEIEAAIVRAKPGHAVRVVRNPDPQRGQQSSVRLGVSALGQDVEAALVVLADQPMVGVEDLRELMEAFTRRPAGAGVLYPVVGGQRGNPVVFSGAVIANLLDAGDHASFRRFIDDHPAVVCRYPTGNAHFIMDLDTPEDVDRFRQQTGLSVHWPDDLIAGE